MWALRLSIPRRSASRSSFWRSLKAMPPCDFVARTVVTSTRGAGSEPAGAAHDVAELLEAEIGGEPRLGDDVVGELQRHAILDDRVVGVRDVAEGPGVGQHGLALQGLDQVRLDGVLHDHRHRAAGLEVVGRHRVAVVGRGHDDAAEPRAEILQVAREREDRHDLGGRGDHEAVLPGNAVRLAAQARHDVAQLTVVHVHGARPGDRQRVDVQRRCRGRSTRRARPRAGCGPPPPRGSRR